jgi:hypothetical protein
MFVLQSTKEYATQPASYSAGATATLQVDTNGYSEGLLSVNFGSLSQPSEVPSVISISESDTTYASTFVTVAGSSQTSNLTSINSAGAASQVVRWSMSLNNGTRKRYQQINVTVTTAQVLDLRAILARPQQSPWNNTLANVVSQINIA